MAIFMIAPLSKLGRLRINHFVHVFSAQLMLMPIAILIIGSSLIDISVIAQTESDDSSDSISEPVKSDDQEVHETEVQQTLPSTISIESRQDDSPKISDLVEVNPRSQQWETIHSGDLSRGTIKFRFNI